MGAQTGADRRGRQPDPRRERKEHRDRRVRGQNRRRAHQRGGDGGAGQQHRSLSPAVDELAEQRAADTDGDGVDAGDQAGIRERAGQPLTMDHETDPEHLQRQPRDDGRGEETTDGRERGE